MRLVFVGLALILGCSGDPIDDELLKPNEGLRAIVEKPAPLVEPSTEYRRFGYDEHGHLIRAKELVNGFEVPLGTKLVKRYPSFLEFQVRADFEDVRDFYTGVDRITKRRFADRKYIVKDGKRAFTIHHSDDSLTLLKLAPRYKKANVFVRPGQLRNQNIRVHMVPEVAEEPYIPPSPARGAPKVAENADPAPSPTSRRSAAPSVVPHDSSESGGSAGGSAGVSGSAGGASGNAGGAGGSAGGGGGSSAGSGGSAAPEGPTALPFGEKVQQGTNAHGQPARWGPYPPEQKVDPTPRIEAWKKANPGKTFLD